MFKISKEKLSLNGKKLVNDGYFIIDIEDLKLLDYFKQQFLTDLKEKCNLNIENISNLHHQVSAENVNKIRLGL